MWAWYPCFLPSSGKTSITLLSLMWPSHLIWSYYCPSTWKTWYLPSPSSALLSSQMTSASVLGVPKITILIAMISYSKKITKQAWQRVKLNRQNWKKTRVRLSEGTLKGVTQMYFIPPSNELLQCVECCVPGQFTRDSLPRVVIWGWLWRHSWLGTDQNPRLPEVMHK